MDDVNNDTLINDRFPFVAINRIPMHHPAIDKIDYVIIDSYAGGYKAVEHLYRLGHDRIAIMAGNMRVSTAFARTKGAKKAMADYGLKFDPKLFVECKYSQNLAMQTAVRILGMKTPPTAVFAQDDNMALGVREAVLSLGLKIPEDVAIVGFDDIDMSALTGIELTTISQKKYEMGIMAAKILIDKITGETPSMVNKVVLDAELVIRKSCGYHLQGAYKR
jgi:DNA-binding LacI/PurR family transcriptional regulator